MNPSDLRQQFQQHFRGEPRLFRAPGRVNLIGEHTDYNDGFVMPAAIDFSTWVAATPRADQNLVAWSNQFQQQFEFDLSSSLSRQRNWTDYVVGMALSLKAAQPGLTGANLCIHGEVPLGAGLSSSASIEVATGFALSSLSGEPIDLVQLARLAQQAENHFVGARCGIMDQFISCLGQREHCLILDCRSLKYTPLPLPRRAVMIIGNTMVKHSLAGGEYNTRRQECEHTVSILSRYVSGVRALRDVDMNELELCHRELPDVIYRRARHVISENQRVLRAAEALKSGDLEQFGGLMAQSHASLRDDYEVSCPELDIMVSIASALPGVFGARMTGGGFGGCIICLAEAGAAEGVARNLRAGYQQQTGITPEIYVSAATAGVEELI